MADYAITRHFPEISISENKYLDFIFEVGSRQASLIAKWLSVGFIHGVMNTDNMSICGETIDYGPCAFMNQYDPNTVFSSIDQNGRYSYGQQKEMAMWNLVRFAETLLPLIDADNKKAIEKTEAILSQLHDLFESNWQELLSQKIGMNAADENATKLSKNLLDLMHNGKLDFNHTFSELSSEILPDSIFLTNLKMKEWYAQWLINVQNQNLDLPQIYKKMKTINPLVVPRNYLVEEALFEAQTNGSFSKFNSLLEILKKPFEHNSVNKIYSLPSASENANYRTFCGT